MEGDGAFRGPQRQGLAKRKEGPDFWVSEEANSCAWEWRNRRPSLSGLKPGLLGTEGRGTGNLDSRVLGEEGVGGWPLDSPALGLWVEGGGCAGEGGG